MIKDVRQIPENLNECDNSGCEACTVNGSASNCEVRDYFVLIYEAKKRDENGD